MDGSDAVLFHSKLCEISSEKEIPDSVDCCVNLLRKYANEGDRARIYGAERQNSRFLSEYIEEMDLPQIGHYVS